MHPKNVEVRGCCMGIPFGCGSVLFLLAGAALWHLPQSGQLPFLLTVLLVSAVGFTLFALALVGSEWLRERRENRLAPAQAH